MLLLIVEVTSPPASQAPANSNIIAIIMACLIVIALAPTEVPMAFATSFAPTPQAIKKANKQAIASSRNPYWEITSDIVVNSRLSGYFAISSSNRLPIF